MPAHLLYTFHILSDPIAVSLRCFNRGQARVRRGNPLFTRKGGVRDGSLVAGLLTVGKDGGCVVGILVAVRQVYLTLRVVPEEKSKLLLDYFLWILR